MAEQRVQSETQPMALRQASDRFLKLPAFLNGDVLPKKLISGFS